MIHIGTINILSKEKADTLLSKGFKYTEQKINDNQVVYSFIDTPEIRKVVSCQSAKNEFYISTNFCFYRNFSLNYFISVKRNETYFNQSTDK